MKKYFFLLLGIIFVVNACNQKKGNFEINIKCSEANNLFVRLFKTSGNSLIIEDSSKFEVSRAQLKGIVSQAELMYIFVDNATDYLPIFVEKGVMEVDLNYSKPGKSTVKGSETHKIFTDFVRSYSAYCDKAAGLNKMLLNARQNNDTIIINGLEADKTTLNQEIRVFEESYVDKYNNSPLACYIISSQLMYDLKAQTLEKLLDKIPQQNRDNKYYFLASEYLEKIKNEDHQTEDKVSQQYKKLSEKLDSKLPLNELIVNAATNLFDSIYVGGTLETENEENLIVNFDKFDCVTFQETCTALALDKKSENPSFENFKQILKNIRYRNGEINGYVSRLHYTSDWINDNIKKGNILDLSKKLGGEKLNKKISFMTSHSALYPKLKDDTLSQQRMLEIENEINQNSIYYIPKSKIQNISAKIKSGNLIFITTATEGLDFAHVGIAINENGVLKMIHASSSAKKVVKTPTSLSEYLKGMKNFTGISVAEVL